MSGSGDALALEGRDLTVKLGGQKVLDVPSFEVYRNEVMMIIGPNGSGKTTLLLTLALLLRPATGHVIYRGQPVSTSDQMFQQRRKLAVVFQEPLLLRSSVMDNVTLGLKLRGLERSAVRQRAEKWLDRFGIAALAKRQARLLSGGEGKRVSLARAFALEPEVMFLDEPFIALDSPTRQSLLEDFESVLRETKTTVVMVTHDRNEGLALGDRVTVLMNGSVRQTGSPRDVFAVPVDEEVAEFVEAGNILRGVISRQENGLAFITINGKQIQVVSDLPEGSQVTAYMHYDDVTLTHPGTETVSSSARNHFIGKITRFIPSSSQVKVFLDCGFQLVTLVTRRSWEELGLDVGKDVVAWFKASAVHLILHHRTGPEI